ncbi:MAG: trypsin-like serine protease [Solirubrobacterales bacterium]|nr:trypsin-like serine protease [Solirubrobacterales bacterium]
MNPGRTRFIELLLAAAVGGAVVALVAFLVVSAGVIPQRDDDGSGAGTVASLATGSGGSDDSTNQVNQIYRDTEAGIGFISATIESRGTPYSPFGGPSQGEATGTGFVIDRDGSMVTNNHVVQGASSVTVRLGDEDYEATVVGADPSSDLALLEVDAPAEALDPLELADSDEVQVGDPVVAIGNPFGLEKTVTTGIVSALQREITATDAYTIPDVIQTDAAINPGNSGGPLLDRDGRVIGVNSQIATGGGSNGNVGIGFAVPSNTVEDVVGQIRETGQVEHPWLGISGRDYSGSDASGSDSLPGRDGVLVEQVVPGGPADRAGLRGAADGPGDLIVRFGSVDEPTMADIARVIDDLEVGDTVELVVVRDGRETEVEVELGDRP